MLPLFLTLISAGPPSLCIEVAPRADVEAASLLAAIRARIARKQVVVKSGCSEPSTWMLALVRLNPVSLSLDLSGPDVKASRTITVDGMTPEEVVQYVSITAAEAVRPSMDKLLATMGLLEQDDDLVAQLEAKEQKCPEAAPCPESKIEVRTVEVRLAPTPAFDLSLGPILGVRGDWAALLEVGGGIDGELFFAALHAGVRWVPGAGEGDIRLRLWELEASLDAGVRLSIVRLGLRAQGRFSISDPAGAPTLPDGLQFFWTGGFGLFSDVAVWSTGIFELRILARAWFWPQPNRFLVEGEPVLTQSYLELMVGPELAFGETFSKAAPAGQ